MFLFFRLFSGSIVSALNELWTNKLRTFLSLLGISIGIFCVIAVLTTTDSMERNIKNSIEKMGSNVIFINRWPWAFNSDYPWWRYVNRPKTNMNELLQMQSKLKSASAVALTVTANDKSVSYGGQTVDNISVNGVTQDYGSIMKFDFVNGRYFTSTESDGGSPVAIIGNEIATNLFPSNVDPIGLQVTVFGSKMTVIGILKKEGESIIKNSNDNLIVVPYNYIKTKIDLNARMIEPLLIAETRPGVSIDEMSDEMQGLMRAIRRQPPRQDDNFSLDRVSMITDFISSIFGALNMAGVIIGLFALLVGGFGIANIMFVSVRERTNLIGIKKAIGAKNHFVLLEFLTESVILSIIGGLFGLLFVYIGAKAAGSAFGFEMVLSEGNIIKGIAISSAIGIMAGLWPALAAARLKPVDAIRFK